MKKLEEIDFEQVLGITKNNTIKVPFQDFVYFMKVLIKYGIPNIENEKVLTYIEILLNEYYELSLLRLQEQEKYKNYEMVKKMCKDDKLEEVLFKNKCLTEYNKSKSKREFVTEEISKIKKEYIEETPFYEYNI